VRRGTHWVAPICLNQQVKDRELSCFLSQRRHLGWRLCSAFHEGMAAFNGAKMRSGCNSYPPLSPWTAGEVFAQSDSLMIFTIFPWTEPLFFLGLPGDYLSLYVGIRGGWSLHSLTLKGSCR